MLKSMLKKVFETVKRFIPKKDFVDRVKRENAIAKAIEQVKNGMPFFVSYGNEKLVSTDLVRFLVWSIPAIVTCPYRCKGCENDCYAKKSEKNYSDCLPCHYRNLIYSLRDDFVDLMTEYLNNQIFNKRTACHKALLKGGKVIFRIHESGDFYNQEYANKWIEIAKRFPMVTFTAYTKSLIYFKNAELPQNFVVLNSVWQDMNKEVKKESYKGTVYTALRNDQIDCMKTYHKNMITYHKNKRYTKNHVVNKTICGCSDCATCLQCYEHKPTTKEIVVAIH